MARRILVPLALVALAVLAIGAWWSMRRSGASEPAAVEAVTQAATHAGVEPTALDAPQRAEATRVANVEPPRATAALVAAHSAGCGSIAGRVVVVDTSVASVTAGWARIQPAPPVQGSVRDADEEMRLFVAQPVALIDREGRFELPRVPLGDWIVTVEPEGFERRSVRVTVARTAPATEVEIHTVTAHPSVLAIDVQDEFGVHAGAEHSAIDANARFALRVVLLDACPELGANLPEKPRELKCENRSAPGGATGPWLTVTFAQPTAGCACAVIGTRVLDVVPFAAGQAGLVLRVSAERLKRERIPLSIVVRDLEGNGPLANATVKFEPRRGRQRVQQTDAQGFARVDDLLAGELTVRVELAGYASARMDTTLEAGRREETHLIQLARAFAIRGRTHSPVAAPERFMIQAFTLHEESGQLHVLTSQDFVVRDGEFALEGLPRGRYIVGIATPDATPDPARVLRGEFPGWVHVDLTRGDVSGVVLEVPQVVILHSGYMWRRESVEELEQRLRDRKVDR